MSHICHVTYFDTGWILQGRVSQCDIQILFGFFVPGYSAISEIMLNEYCDVGLQYCCDTISNTVQIMFRQQWHTSRLIIETHD